MKTLRIITTLMFIAIAGMIISTSGAYATPVSQGDWITLDYAPSDYPRYIPGGPFRITEQAKAVDFITFCVETNEYFSPGGKYYVGSISSVAINGGVGGGSPDPLDPKTAYLYYKFITGNYPKGYSADLQQVIWYIEGEYTGSLSITAQALLADATLNAPAGLGGDPLWGVRVVNLYDDAHVDASGKLDHFAQDQLVYVPEPGTLLFLGVTLVGISLAARRRRRSA